MGYLDGQAFMQFDHTKWRAEPQRQWAERLGAETWDTESKDLNEASKELLRKLLAEILSLQKEKRGERAEGARVLWAIFEEGLQPRARASFL